MAIDPKKARVALEKELKSLTPAKFRERLEVCIPPWADPALQKQASGQAKHVTHSKPRRAKGSILPQQG